MKNNIQSNLRDILRNEKKELLDYRINDINLWALIRCSVLSYTLSKNKELFKSHSGAYDHISRLLYPKMMRKIIETWAFLKKNNTKFQFRSLFITTAAFRRKSEHTKKYASIYDPYFKKSSNPLILEQSFEYRMFSPENYSKNIYLMDTITILSYIESLRVKLPKEVVIQVDKFSKKVVNLFGIEERENKIRDSVTKLLKIAKPLQSILESTLIPKISNKVAFVHAASFMGYTGLINSILHKNGFVIIEPQHGFVSQEHYAYNYSDEININLLKKYLPDYFLMYGEYWKEQIKIPSKVYIVGSPYSEQKSKELIKEIINDDSTILIVSQGTVTYKMVKIAKYLSKKLPNKKIIFKLHPSEISFKERYNELHDYHNVEVIGFHDIYDLIAKSSIIVGYNSTTLFESLLFPDKRIFILKNDEILDGIGYKFSNEKELYEKILKGNEGYPSLEVEYFWQNNWEERFEKFLIEENLSL